MKHWIITGHVVEQESGAGVGGLWIHTRDRDEQAPDLEIAQITDEDGKFVITYDETTLIRHQNDAPKILVEMIGPPGRTLWQTSLRFGVEPVAPIEVRLSRRHLGAHSPGNPEDRVSAGVGLSKAMLRVREQGGRSWTSLPGYSPAGAPEQPMVLERIHNVIIPLGDDAPELIVHAGEPVRIPLRTPPGLRPPAIIMHDAHPDGRPIKGRLPYTVLRTRAARAQSQAPVARIDGIQTRGPVRIVNVVLCPLRYDADRNEDLLYPDLRYEVRFDMARARRLLGGGPAHALTREDAVTLERMLSQIDRVFRAKDLQIAQAPAISVRPSEQYEHVIITVNDFRGEFEALSRWKMKRGVRSRVVTLEDIKDGKVVACEDYKKSTRDDAEILRNFIRWAHSIWDAKYVLLGGDVNHIPMRKVTHMWGLCVRPQRSCPWEPVDPTDYWKKRRCCGTVTVEVTSATLKFTNDWKKDCGLDKEAIVRPQGKTNIISYSEDKNKQPRWYFGDSKEDDDFATVIVEEMADHRKSPAR